MFRMCYKIRIGGYLLQALDSVTITKSVENLAGTAVIVLPGTRVNEALHVEDKIEEGDAVEIQLGYNDDLKTEFTGYLNSISTDDGSIRLNCLDSLYLFKKVSLKDAQYENVSLKELLNTVVKAVDPKIEISCDYDFKYEKFVFFRATGFDVLKKVQEETKANIYFRDNVLHVHPPYSEILNREPVIYDFAKNIEKSNLKYIKADDKKIEIEVVATLPNGKTKKQTYGNPGGIKKTVTSPTDDEPSMKLKAKSEHDLWYYSGYEGTFTGWLIPFVEPAYKITLRDSQYTDKEGVYYVVAVETKFSSAGGSRTITPGKKIGGKTK